MEVEGGQIGRALLILLFALWCWSNSSRLPSSDRVIIRLVFIAFACHAVTDNVLISTSASVLFTFISAVFARGRLEIELRSALASNRTFACPSSGCSPSSSPYRPSRPSPLASPLS
jgi:hypothetical protein